MSNTSKHKDLTLEDLNLTPDKLEEFARGAQFIFGDEENSRIAGEHLERIAKGKAAQGSGHSRKQKKPLEGVHVKA